MANKLINEMGLPKWIANIFAARNIITAKDALSITEFELMELLDVGLAEVTSAIAHISEVVCPPCQTALYLMEHRVQHENLAGHLPTRLKGLDDALCGGIPFGALTELVGPAGIGKTQFCLKLSLLASLPPQCGGLDSRVIYIDAESKFSSKRLIEIGIKSFPEIFHKKGMAQEMAGRILIFRPTSLSELTESLHQIKLLILQQQVKLLIIDSMAALALGEESGASSQKTLGWHVSFIKSLAEFSRIPVVVTNQVRSQIGDEACLYPFQVAQSDAGKKDNSARYDSHLVAALGISWAHAVTIRLVLEAKSGILMNDLFFTVGLNSDNLRLKVVEMILDNMLFHRQRFIKLSKSPVSPPLAFGFKITSSGIVLLDNIGMELKGSDINTIHFQGQNTLFSLEEEKSQ